MRTKVLPAQRVRGVGMTIHFTWEGVFAVIGVAAVTAWLIYLLVGLFIWWRWGK